MAVATIDHHLEATPGTCGGKVRIAGRRITVHQIAIWHEQCRESVEDIAKEYDLSLADVHAALAYYYDNRPDIDREIAESEAFVERMRAGAPSMLELKPGLLEQYEREY